MVDSEAMPEPIIDKVHHLGLSSTINPGPVQNTFYRQVERIWQGLRRSQGEEHEQAMAVTIAGNAGGGAQWPT